MQFFAWWKWWNDENPQSHYEHEFTIQALVEDLFGYKLLIRPPFVFKIVQIA